MAYSRAETRCWNLNGQIVGIIENRFPRFELLHLTLVCNCARSRFSPARFARFERGLHLLIGIWLCFPGGAIVEVVIAGTLKKHPVGCWFPLKLTSKFGGAFVVLVFVGTTHLRLFVGMLDNICKNFRHAIQPLLIGFAIYFFGLTHSPPPTPATVAQPVPRSPGRFHRSHPRPCRRQIPVSQGRRPP